MPVFPDDPYGGIKGDKKRATSDPREVNAFHASSDVDLSVFSQHHSLGIKHNQASSGDHVHDGSSSRKIGAGMSLTCNTGTSTAADLTALLAMLHQVIEFTET